MKAFGVQHKHEFGVRDVHIAVSQAIQLYQYHTLLRRNASSSYDQANGASIKNNDSSLASFLTKPCLLSRTIAPLTHHGRRNPRGKDVMWSQAIG